MLHFGAKFITLPTAQFLIKFDTSNLLSFTNASISQIAFKGALICLFLLNFSYLHAYFLKNVFMPVADVNIVSDEINELSKLLRELNIKCFFWLDK